MSARTLRSWREPGGRRLSLRHRLVFHFLIVFSLVPGIVGAAQQLTEAQQRGQLIYTEGRGRQPISAYLAGPDITLPGENFSCIRCHLEDGSGNKEGGIVAHDITFVTLTAPHTGTRASGRIHPVYNEEALGAAILHGIDPGGNALHPAMPRYEMETGDLADLVAYIKVLGHQPVPGVTEELVRVGTVLPRNGPLQGAAAVIEMVLDAYFDELNQQGGLFGRRLQLEVIRYDPGDDSATQQQVIEQQLDRTPVFSLLNNLGLPLRGPLVRMFSQRGLPVIGPLVIVPEDELELPANTFYLYASVYDQARVLVDFLAADLKHSDIRIAVLHDTDGPGRKGLAGVQRQAQKHRMSLVGRWDIAGNRLSLKGLVAQLRVKRPDALFFFGNSRYADALAREMDHQQWHPIMLSLAEMVGSAPMQMSEASATNIYLASPQFFFDPGARGARRFFELVGDYQLPRSYRTYQLAAYAGARLLEEGLKRTGRQTTRAKLLDAVEHLWQFDTGVMAPLSFDKNQRIGSKGALVMRVDLEKKTFSPASDWRTPED